MRTFLSTFFLIIFICAVGVVSYWIGSKDTERVLGAKTAVPTMRPTPTFTPTPVLSSAPVKAATIAQPPSPIVVTNNFYQWYLKCKTTQQNCDYVKSGYAGVELKTNLASIKGYDPVFCSQNLPSKVEPDVKQTLFNGTASTSMIETFGTTKKTTSVDLKLLNGKWQIVNVHCI